MQSGRRVGSLFGIPLLIDPSWFVILIFVAFIYGGEWRLTYPQWGAGLAYGTALVMALLLFVSVLLHELGHSLVARSQGIKVNSITLFLFGGIASIDQESKTPEQAFQVAIAGPLVSIFIALSCWTLVQFLPGGTSPITVVINRLAGLNLFLAIFNLLPGLPLDGGQVLKAAVWKFTGSRLKGVHWAAKSGKILGWTAILLGVTAFFFGGSGLWVALIGWFVLQNASAYDRITDLQEALLSLRADDAMTREFRVVDADMSLRQFADDYLLNAIRPVAYFAASDGRYRGLVLSEDMHYIERSEWETNSLYRIIKPLPDIPSVHEATPLVDVIQQLETQDLRLITVLSPAGAVSGVIDRGDVVRALTQKMKIQVSDAVIKQIKEDGCYPPGLQIEELARSAAEAIEVPSR